MCGQVAEGKVGGGGGAKGKREGMQNMQYRITCNQLFVGFRKHV
jgi:hypothetical protein